MFKSSSAIIPKNKINRKKLTSSFRWFKGIKQKELTPQKFTPYILDTIIYSHDFITSTKHCIIVETLHFSIEYIIFLTKIILI